MNGGSDGSMMLSEMSSSSNTAQMSVSEADLLTAVEFDPSGEYLAAGDRGGCICVFKASGETKRPVATTSTPIKKKKKKKISLTFWKSKKSKERESEDGGDDDDVSSSKADDEDDGADRSFEFHVDFQSHEPEFDYLKSLEIEEKINKIKWFRRASSSMMLLSTNDKTIKLWKVYEKQIKVLSEMGDEKSRNVTSASSADDALRIPKIPTTKRESAVGAKNTRKYVNAHAYHINSISVCSDGETFLSSDDLRVNLWHMSRPERSFNIVDIKPENMEELTEVITASVFHPTQCQTFMYSTSCGKILVGDLRAGATCNSHMSVLFEADDTSNNSFFSEIIASISDIHFSGCGRYALSRNYLGIKVWDLAMAREPVSTIDVSDYLRPKLCDLYENDCIFDKFELSVSGDGRRVCTGSYHNIFHIFDREGKRIADKEAKVPIPSPASDAVSSASKRKSGLSFGRTAPAHVKKSEEDTFTLPSPSDMNFENKILHTAWHPKHEKVALASKNLLYIYANVNDSS